MRIDERKRRIRCQRDALAWGRQRANSTRCGRCDASSASDDGFEIEVPFGHVREAIEARSQVAMLARLDKAEVPRGQNDMVLARQRAEDANAELCDRIGHQGAMAVAADAVEHDARDAD